MSSSISLLSDEDLIYHDNYFWDFILTNMLFSYLWQSSNCLNLQVYAAAYSFNLLGRQKKILWTSGQFSSS